MLDMLRKYWNPVATSDEVTTTPLKRVMLDEQLVVWRSADGRVLPEGCAA